MHQSILCIFYFFFHVLFLFSFSFRIQFLYSLDQTIFMQHIIIILYNINNSSFLIEEVQEPNNFLFRFVSLTFYERNYGKY
jgi:hypothetical protein